MKEPNKQRLLELADRIEKLPHYDLDADFCVEKESFNMSRFMKKSAWPEEISCGTVSCLAGWTVALFMPEKKKIEKGDMFSFPNVASELLGLDLDIANRLFYVAEAGERPGASKSLQTITPQEAAQACRNVADGAKTFKAIWG